MTVNNKSQLVIVGSFENTTQAEQAIRALHDAGFQNEQIGFLVRNSADIVAGPLPNQEAEMVTDTAGGAISGGILGGIVGAAVALLIPGVGPAIAGGILAATLGGVLVGATAGGIIGALTGMGVSQEEAEYYQRQFEAGNTIVAVNVDDRTQNPQEVRAILNRYGATDINVQPAPNIGNDPATSPAQERTYNPKVPPATYNATTQPPPETQSPVTPEGRYNSNVPPATYNEPSEQPDNMQEPEQQ
jgi:uncharacterized membrane protein